MGVSKVPAFASACLHSLLLLNLNPLFHGLARHLIKQPPYFYFLFFFLVEVLTLSCPCTFNLKQNLCTTFNLNKIYSSFQCMNKHDKSSISLALIGATQLLTNIFTYNFHWFCFPKNPSPYTFSSSTMPFYALLFFCFTTQMSLP